MMTVATPERVSARKNVDAEVGLQFQRLRRRGRIKFFSVELEPDRAVLDAHLSAIKPHELFQRIILASQQTTEDELFTDGASINDVI